MKKAKRVNTYLPEDVVERLDRHVERLTKDDPAGRGFTRTDVIRILVVEGLNKVDAK